MIKIEKVRALVVDRLENELSPSLYYHSLKHTRDVVESSLRIAAYEGIQDLKKLLLLETAAWFHDIGFTRVYQGHEMESCVIAREELPGLGATPADIEVVEKLIIATQIPQLPTCQLCEIICDADLDYLGRTDFDVISNNLCKEWIYIGFIQKEEQFHDLQIRFLKNHHFFTKFGKTIREPKKAEKLALLEAESIG